MGNVIRMEKTDLNRIWLRLMQKARMIDIETEKNVATIETDTEFLSAFHRAGEDR